MKTSMPIRAAPFAHQQQAYEFACRLFGIGEEDDSDNRNLRDVRKVISAQTERPEKERE